MKTLKSYLSLCLANGKYFFSKEEAIRWIETSDILFLQQAHRLMKKGELKNLGHGFYMIVPDEYAHMGALPSPWIVDALMSHLNKPYYIGLLSAAGIHGAAHQQPMTFQVIVEEPLKKTILPRGAIEFYSYKYAKTSLVTQIKTPVGKATLSSRGQTMLDLLRFQMKCGYINNVATIIRDLSEDAEIPDLKSAIMLEKEKTVLQRLGYIFEVTNFHKGADLVEKSLRKRQLYWTPLFISREDRQGEKMLRWKIIINDTLEFD